MMDFENVFLNSKSLRSSTIFALALAINLAFLRLNPAFTLMSTQPVLPAEADIKDPLISELTRLMKEDRLYADHDLRIADVAAQLKILG